MQTRFEVAEGKGVLRGDRYRAQRAITSYEG